MTDDINAMLEDGWTVAGYSTCLAQLGTITHHVLLQKGSDLTTVMVGIAGTDETWRSVNTLAPTPARRKGWFG